MFTDVYCWLYHCVAKYVVVTLINLKLDDVFPLHLNAMSACLHRLNVVTLEKKLGRSFVLLQRTELFKQKFVVLIRDDLLLITR